MADIESNVRFNIDASGALQTIKNLQRQISAFHTSMSSSGIAANTAISKNLQRNLIDQLNATGKFTASITNVQSTTESFTSALEKNKFSMGEYFRYAGGATRTFGKLFSREMQTIEKVAIERVKTLQTQYIKLGRDASGALQAIAVRPAVLDMDNLATKTAIAAQKQQLFNQLMRQGSTNLLNFGKNTQWAGRQLMVGFTIPLTIFATTAAKTFMDVEKQAIRFKRVYGDAFSLTSETDAALDDMKRLASEFTKYGVQIEKTLELAADAAAMGLRGAALTEQVTNATRLAVLGEVEQQEALEATISLTNAFGTATEDLAAKINFLNAVENETVTAISDLTIAIPKAAPVVKQLGGDVEDLAFFLTAMKEGGINASEGANALKSGLASLINPTDKASQMLAGFGINIKQIVEGNKGDIKAIVIDFAKALDTLDPLNRARAIEQLFGKFQFSRLSTLFQNVIKQGTQAERVLKLTQASSAELAILSERELKRVEESTSYKFQKAIEDLRATLVPLGEAFLKAITPFVDFATGILNWFNKLDEGFKNFAILATTAIAGIGPVVIMTFGLLSNGLANIIKMLAAASRFFLGTGASSKNLATQTEYLTQQQLENAAVAASLEQVHSKLTQSLLVEATAANALAKAYQGVTTAQGKYGTYNPTTKNFKPALKLNSGTMSVPGPRGAGDIVPAMLSPGEAVIPAKQAQKYSGFIQEMISGNIPEFRFGAFLGMPKSFKRVSREREAAEEIFSLFKGSRYASRKPEQYMHQLSSTTGFSFPIGGVGGVYVKPDGSRVFVKPVATEQAALAELRGTQIAREVHGLDAPVQRIVVMRDPTDRTGQRRFLALESPLDPTFATPTGRFTKKQYIKQLVASALRGDKDLSASNIFGNVVADVGPAGVMTRASGIRGYARPDEMLSLEQQAIINLLGVKGGAKKAFAQSTSDIARSMSPEEFSRLIREEIYEALPKLQQAITRFDLTPQELTLYQAMVRRLEDGLSVDWRRIHQMHTAVPFVDPNIPKYARGVLSVPGPKGAGDVVPAMLAPGEAVIPAKQASKYAGLLRGIVSDNIPGYVDSNVDDDFVKTYGRTGKGASILPDGTSMEKTHIGTALKITNLQEAKALLPYFRDQLQFEGTAKELLKFAQDFKIEIVSNLTAELRESANQALRRGGSGLLREDFIREWNDIRGKLYSSARMAGLDLNDPAVRSLIDKAENELGKDVIKEVDRRQKEEDAAAKKEGRQARAVRIFDIARNDMPSVGLGDTTSRTLIRLASGKDARMRELATGLRTLEASPAGFRTKLEDIRANRGQLTLGRSRSSKYKNDPNAPQNQLQFKGINVGSEKNGKIKAQGDSNKGYRVQPYFANTAEGFEAIRTGAAVRPAAIPGQSTTDAAARQDRRTNKKNAGATADAAEDLKQAAKSIKEATAEQKEIIKNNKKYLANVDSQGRRMLPGALQSVDSGRFFVETPDGKLVQVKQAGALAPERGAKFTEEQIKTTQLAQYGKATPEEIRAARSVRKAEATARKAAGAEEARQRKITARARQIEIETARETARVAIEEQRLLEQRAAQVAAQRKVGRYGFAAGALVAGAGVVNPDQNFMQTLFGSPEAVMNTAFIGLMVAQLLPIVGKVIKTVFNNIVEFAKGPASKFMKIGSALTAIAAAFAIAIPIVNAFTTNFQKQGAELAKSMGMTNDKLQKMAEFFGTVSATELADAQRAQQRTGAGQEELSLGELYLDSDSGKALLADIEKQVNSGIDWRMIGKNVGLQLSVAVAQGVLEGEQANSIAAALSEKFDNISLGVNISGTLLNLIGPNGEDLTKDPLEVTLKISQESARQTEAQFDIFNAKLLDIPQQRMEDFGELILNSLLPIGATVGGLLLGGPIGAGAGFAGSQILTGLFPEIPGGFAAISDEWSNFMGSFGEETATRAAMVGLAAQDLATAQSMVDVLNQQYAIRMAEAETVQQINDLEAQRKQDVADLNAQNAINLQQLKGFIADYPLDEGTLLSIAETQYAAGTFEQSLAKAISTNIANLEDSEIKTNLALGFVSKQFSLTTLGKIMEWISSGNTETTSKINLLLDAGAGFKDIDQLIQLAVGDEEISSEGYDRLLDGFLADTANLTTNLETLSRILKLQGQIGVDIDLNNPNIMADIQELSNSLSVLYTALPESINKNLAIDIDKQTGGLLAGVLANWDRLVGAENSTTKEFILSLIAQVEFRQSRNALAAEYYPFLPPEAVTDEMLYARLPAPNLPGTGQVEEPEPTTSGGTGKLSSSLDDLVKKLKQVRDASIKLTEGWAESAKTLKDLFGGSKTIQGFNGLAQQLRALGGTESFIEFILGMPPEEFEEQKNKIFKFDASGAISGFKDLGKSIMEALAAFKLGEFQNEQQSIFQNVANQFAAVNKLIQSGVSLADAYEIVQDAALAAAIAHETNSETLKQLAQDIQAATAATKRFAAAQALAGTVQDTIDQGKILSFIQKNMGIMNNDIIQGILNDPELQQLILLGGDLTGEEAKLIEQRLQQILDNAKLELEIKKLTIEGMEEIFNDGFDKAMEAFSAQEKAIEIQFDLQTQADQDIIQNAEEQIALINYQIDDYEASLKEIEDQEVEVNKKYDDRIAALDEIQKANEAITAQQQAQLTIADAITQGDMFAAAKAIEDLRAEQAQQNIQTQQEQLNNARQIELDELRTKAGLTREEIEKRIKDLQDQIFQIEENSLEPAQERIRLATIEKEEAIEQLRVLGLTREEWEAIQNRIDLARTSSDSYTEAITEAKNIVEDIVNYWEELDGKEVNVTQIITTIRKEAGTDGITTPESAVINDGPDGPNNPNNTDDTQTTPGTITDAQRLESLKSLATSHINRLQTQANTQKSLMLGQTQLINRLNKEINELNPTYDMGEATTLYKLKQEAEYRLLQYTNTFNSLNRALNQLKSAISSNSINALNAAIAAVTPNGGGGGGGTGVIARATGGRVPRNTKPEIWSSAGGAVNDFAAGKYAQGTDTVPAMLTPGEYVVNARAVSKLGTAFLNKVNTGNVKGLAMGGAVNEQAPQVATVGSHFEDRLVNGEVDKLAQGGLVSGKAIESDRPQVPVRFPISGGYKVSSPFGSRNGSHHGVDLVARPAGNVPIRAAEPGRVTAARKSTATGGGYGQYVKLLGQSGTEHIFAHLQNTPLVSKGELISVGRMLGRMGMTGNATGTHLHWETRKGVNGKRQDPMGWIRRMQESGVAPKPYQPFGVKGTYNGEVRQKSGYYYTWSVPQQKWIKGARVPASAAIAKPNTGSGTLPPASNNRPPQMLALGGLVGPMIDGGGQKFAPFGKAGSYPGQIKAYAGYNYSWNIGTQKWVKGSKVPVASQNTTQAAITAMQQDKQIVSQGTAPTYPPFGKVGKAGEVRKYGGYYYSWNNSSRKWVKGVKVLTTPEQTVAQAQEQLMQRMQDSYMSVMDVAIDPRTGQVMGFGEMPTTSFEQLPPALQLEAFRNSRNYDNMLVSYQVEMQKQMQENAKAQQDALYRQGGFQGFEAGFQGFMADAMAYLDSDKGTILGAKVTDILANPFVQGIGAVLSIPAELVGGLVQKGLATANLAKQGDWLNALLMGTLGFELSGQYGAPGLQALANPFVNAFGGGDGKTMFERAALTGIDLFGTENDPEMAALARIIGGTLNLVGDPLNYVGAGLISKAAGIGKLGNAAKNLIAKMDARGMLNNRGAISVVPQKPNNRVDIGTQEVEFGDKLVTSYLLGDNTKPIVFQGYKRKPHEDPIGDNLGLDYSDLERNGIDIVGTRPDELIDAAIRLNPNNPNNAKLKQMQENIQNGIFETDELELLDNINAAILLDNSGLPIPLKVGSIPVQDINPAGFALVLKSLMGDQIASNILNFRRNKFLEIIASHPLRSARQKATYVTGEGPKLVDLSPQQQLDEFLNPSNSNPFDQSIYPTEVLSQIANTSLDPSKVSLIHSVKPQYGITRDKNGNVVLNPSGRYLYKDREVRSSIHFSLDSPVQSHALGTWGHTNRKIVTPLSSAIDESGFPYALNPEDTWWMRNPGQPMIFKNASVIHPFTNIQEYAAELVKRGLIREGEIPPLIAVDPNTRDILHIFKESYTDADSALLTQIFKDTGLYNREKHFSGIAPDIETIDEAALALAKKQIGADIVPIRNREISEGYASKDQMFNALIEKFRLEQNLYKNANMTVGLHTFLRAGRFETIGGAARRGATMHDSIEAYRYAALSGHFQPDVRYLDSSPLLSSTKTFTAPSVGAKGLNNRGSISPELALWFLPPKIRAKLLARADGNNPRLAGKSKIADMLLNRAKRRVPPLDRELMDELAYLNPRWNVLKESGLDGLTPADVQDLIKDLPKVYDFRKTSGSSYRKYKYAYAQVQAFNAQIAKNNLNELTPDAAERALLENESLEIDFPGQEDIPSGLFGRELMDADTAALGLRSFNLNAFNTWFSKQVRGTFRQFPKLYKDRFRKQAQDFIDGYDSTIVNPDNPFGMVDNRKMQMYDSVLGLVDPDAAQAMGLDLAGRGLLPLRRTEFDQSVAQPKFLDLFLDSQYLQDDLTTFLQTPIAQAMLNAGDQPMRFRDLIRAGLEDTRIFRRLKDAKNPDQIQRFATGGEIIGSDTIPAMLTPGEYVVRRSAVNRFGKDFFDRINNGTVKPIYGKPSFGIKPVNKPAFKVPGSGMTPTVKPVFDTKINDSVYNYSINVNVRSDANPDQIARSVMSQIKQIDSMRMRGNRF